MSYMDENISCKDYIKCKYKPCLVYIFTVNVRSMEYAEAETQIFMTTEPLLSALCHSLLLFLSWLRCIFVPFVNVWKRWLALCKSRYYGHISKRLMPNSLGLWYTQMVFLFCIFANVITKYNNFSSKVIRAHLAPSLICPTCYLLITLWGDLVVLLLLKAKWPRG